MSLGIRERNPAFRQQIFDVAEAQGESEIEPNRLLNDLRREPVPFVADFLHPLGYWTARGTASPKRRDNAAVRAYHGALQEKGITPSRPPYEDNVVTEAVLMQG